MSQPQIDPNSWAAHNFGRIASCARSDASRISACAACRVEIGRVLSKLRWSGAFHANFRRKTSFHTSDLEGCTRYYGFIHVPHLTAPQIRISKLSPCSIFCRSWPQQFYRILRVFPLSKQCRITARQSSHCQKQCAGTTSCEKALLFLPVTTCNVADRRKV